MKSHKKEASRVLTLLLGESSEATDEVTMMKKGHWAEESARHHTFNIIWVEELV